MDKSHINPMPAFFDRYINLAENIELLEALDKYAPESVFCSPDKLKALGDEVYAPGKWTIKDILQHVIDTERIMAYRAMRFSRNDKTVLPGFEEDLFAANTMASERTVDDLLAEFKLVRLSTIALFQNMTDEMMLRKGFAFKSELSALAIGYVIVGHPVHHMNVISERYFTLIENG